MKQRVYYPFNKSFNIRNNNEKECETMNEWETTPRDIGNSDLDLQFVSDSIGARVNSNISINSNKPTYLATEMEATHVREKGVVEGSEHIAGGKENEEVLKNIIATHPLYEVLVQSHINCLISSIFFFFSSLHISFCF